MNNCGEFTNFYEKKRLRIGKRDKSAIKSLLKSKKCTKSLQDKKFALNLHPHLGIGLWCNGNTPVFGTDIQGSSPCRPT